MTTFTVQRPGRLMAAVLAGLCLGTWIAATLPLAGAPVQTGRKMPVEKNAHDEAAEAFEKALAQRRPELDKARAEPGAIGTAAKILREERDARVRQAAVKYLGTLESLTRPEIEEVLIASLRADRNETVRWAAALALSQGNCCTKRIAAALQICASGSQQDGNAAETSERVQKAARLALDVCQKKLQGKNGPRQK
jgi:hypothetical protein